MAVCTFFGHRVCPDTLKTQLCEVLTTLITQYEVDMFYVGNQGQFDAIVRRVLKEYKKKYAWIEYAVVLAYMPGVKSEYDDVSDTMLPEGIEAVHPRYAISWRNRWMLQRSDYVVTYVTHPWGGAARYANDAAKKGKKLINLERSCIG